MTLLFTTLGLLALAVLLLSVGIILKPNSSFPNTHVGGNKAMQERGIACHTSQHRDAQMARSLSERVADREK